MSVRGWLLVSVAALALNCGAGQVAEKVRPDALTATEAMGEKGCFAVEGRSSPLVVDWKPDQRGDIEVAMKDGIAVVQYTCNGIRLLPDCRVEGQYGFVGVSRKEQVIQLKNGDEIRANLPRTGGLLGAKLEGELARGASLDVALLMVGKRRTTRAKLAVNELSGECKGATHFVRGAMVGAFAMTTGTRAEVRSVAQVFGGGGEVKSGSARLEQSKDGAVDACAAATPNDNVPPSQCGALIRLDLVSLSSAAASTDDARAADDDSAFTCPRGMVLARGKCATAASEPTHECRDGDHADCSAQCSQGDARSCLKLGHIYTFGTSSWSGDPVSSYELACKGGVARGCVLAASAAERLLRDGRPYKDWAPERPMQLYAQACDAGDSEGCLALATKYELGKAPLGAPDLAKAKVLFARACAAGDARGCGAARKLVPGASTDPKERLTQECDRGEADSCGSLGSSYENGTGAFIQDFGRAAKFYDRACVGGQLHSCTALGDLYEAGRGVPKDHAKATSLWKRACDPDLHRQDGNGCMRLRGFGPGQEGAYLAEAAKQQPQTPGRAEAPPSVGPTAVPPPPTPSSGATATPTTQATSAMLDGKPLCVAATTRQAMVAAGSLTISETCVGSAVEMWSCSFSGAPTALSVTSASASRMAEGVTIACSSGMATSRARGTVKLTERGGQKNAVGECSCTAASLSGGKQHSFTVRFDTPVTSF